MPQDKITLKLDKNYTNLEIINGVKFTAREIDILAWIMSGKAGKTSAFFLSISPKTVETHTRNIMRKLECNSREEIINFVEKSEKAELIRAHYRSLLIHGEFEKYLKEISTFTRQEKILCILHPYQSSNQKEFNLFIQRINEDLEKVGFKITQTKGKQAASVEKEETIYDIYFSEEEQKDHQVKQISFKDSRKAIYVLFNKENINEGLENTVYFKKEDYHLFFLKLLKKILPDKKLDEIFLEFKKWQDNTQSTYTSIFPNFYERKNTRGILKDSFIQIVKKKRVTVLASIVCISAFSLGIFALKKDPSQEINQKSEIQKTQNIRSDLNVPTENTLLKRPKLIKQIDDKLKGKSIETVALIGIVGMGGVGKTTIARTYGKTYQSSLVWEINAETKESLLSSFKDLAYVLARTKEQKEELDFIQKIQDQVEKEKKILSFVKEHLRSYPHWLLIFDNVESFQNIKQYFPQDAQIWGPGKVIVTTRDSTIKNTSYIKQENVIEIGQLTELEALTLFSKILYNTEPDKLSKEQREEAIQFLKKIPPFPLDVSIAAYYIKDTHCTFEQYLERIQQYSENFEKVQENLLKEVTDYTKTRYGIITSSLEKFIQANSEYKELLFFISLLDSQNIPKELLEFYKDSTLVDNFLHELKKSGLITSENIGEKKEEKYSFSLHRSTQAIGLVFLNNLLPQSVQSIYIEKITESIKTFYEYYYEKNYINIVNIISHVEALLSNFKNLSMTEDLKEKYKAKLLLILGYSHYKCSHNFKLARESFSQIFNIKKYDQYIPKETLAILLKDIGLICGDLYDLDNAILYSKESIKLCELLPNSEILLAGNLKTIAYAYCRKNDFNQSNYFFKEALKRISKLPSVTKRELESDIYAHLASLYSKTLF